MRPFRSITNANTHQTDASRGATGTATPDVRCDLMAMAGDLRGNRAATVSCPVYPIAQPASGPR